MISMVLFASIVFFSSALLIFLLFFLNIREYATGRYYLQEWRVAVDREALQLKELLAAADLDLPTAIPIGRVDHERTPSRPDVECHRRALLPARPAFGREGVGAAHQDTSDSGAVSYPLTGVPR